MTDQEAMIRHVHLIIALLLFSLSLSAQEGPIFVNEGETVVYYVSRDPQGRKGTVSDALQNFPGVKVDTEGNISLRGVNEVEIFINGKPSHFDPESQKNYLQQVSAASIDRIEVMTNPSARYTTETDTGIINIVTDGKSRSERHLSVGFQVNTKPNLSPWISYIWNNEKFSFTANLKGTYSNTWKHTDSYSYSFVNQQHRAMDTATYIRSYSDDTARYSSMEVFLKGEYQPNDQNDFMVYFNITPNKSKTISLSNTYRKEYIDDIGEYEYTIYNDNLQLMAYGSMGFSWHHSFAKPGHSLGFQTTSDYDFGDNTAKEIRNFKDQTHLNRNIRQTNDFLDLGNESKLEYTYPYSPNGELYVSLTNTFMPDNNIGLYDTVGADGYVNDALRSENRKFSKDHLMGVIMVQHQFGRLTVKPGLGYETTWLRARYFDTPEYDTLIHFAHWLPSFHLSYRTDSQHNFSLSYTRKTNYPWMRYFTRRINYQEESLVLGNPMLKPTLIDVFELSWSKYWENLGSVNVKGYYNNPINAINQVSDVTYSDVWGRWVPYSKPVNLNKYFEAGGEFNLTYRPSATFNVRLDANVFDSYIETLYEKTQDSVIISELLAYNLRLSTWAKLWDKLEIHATAYYNSPTQTLFATNQTAYGIDCGLRADFLNKRLSVLLNAYDIFNWNKEDNYTFNPYYISYSSYKANSRYVSLELVYRVL
ncbi:MAG: outer membrane beta-barrel protein [Bacteroidales bacterium]|nr:outer membrane beta-barrel protein [Bacteroidales bacterium]